MNSNVDVFKELEKKNKEIYLNKLIVDIDNNSEILVITINNMIELFTKEIINKVIEIHNNQVSYDEIEKIVKPFQKNINNRLVELVNIRSLNLKENISISNEFEYDNILENEKDDFIRLISEYYNKNVSKLINKLLFDLDSFNKDRLSDYLKKLYYDRFINKLKEILYNTNMILCNNYQAGMVKFENMNKKMLNSV